MASHGRLAAAWIIGILSLGVHPTAAQADLPALEILPNGEMQTKPISSSIVFRCRSNVNSDLISNMQWIDPQGRVIESRGLAVLPIKSNLTIHTELHEDRSLSLFFNSLQESQAGTYTCEATYSNTKLTKSVKIDTIEAITWENAPEHQRAIKGQNFTIMCKVRARPSPSIDWLYNGTLLKTQDRYIVDAHGLTIQNIQESDDRYYTCRASVPTTGELKEREIHVEVLIRPTIKEISAPIEVIEGESARIECEASGKPPPQITWVKSLTKQNLSMSEGFGVDPDKGVLTITTVNRKDAGEYQCIASNTAGSATTTIVVNVIVKPKIIEFPNSTVAQGDEVNMECRAFGRPPPQVMFRKHTAEKAYILGAQPDDNRLVLKNQMDNVTGETLGILNIRDVRRSNDGLYECIAQNAGGMAFKNGHLTVEFPPSFASMPNDTVAWSWDQRPVNLTCTADSIPNATITWTTQGENSVKNIPHIQQIGNGPTSVLMIHPLDKKFYTYYKCIAVNKHGSKERVFELREASKPGELLQAKIVEMTATTIKFDLILPPTFTDLPIKTVVVQYKEERENWASAKNKSWSANSTYVLSDLKPQTTYDFRFAAMNDVGLGSWNQFLRQTTPGRSFPNEPKIVTKGEEYDVSSFSNQYEVKWLAPPDNGEPIDMYMIKYCQIKRVDRDWETLDNCRSVEVKSSGRLKQWLKDLQPDTFYSVEVRAHNIMGFSKPGSAKFKTAVGIDTKVVHHEGPLISSAAIIGIVIAVLFIIIVIIDVICCCAHKTGIIYYVCERSKRKPVDEEDAKLGRDEKEPLKEEKKITPIIDSGLRRETSVTFDGKRSVSKTGFVGKDSAV